MQSSKLGMWKGYFFYQMVYIRVTKRLGLGAEPPRVYKTFLNTPLPGRIALLPGWSPLGPYSVSMAPRSQEVRSKYVPAPPGVQQHRLSWSTLALQEEDFPRWPWTHPDYLQIIRVTKESSTTKRSFLLVLQWIKRFIAVRRVRRWIFIKDSIIFCC